MDRKSIKKLVRNQEHWSTWNITELFIPPDVYTLATDA